MIVTGFLIYQFFIQCLIVILCLETQIVYIPQTQSSCVVQASWGLMLMINHSISSVCNQFDSLNHNNILKYNVVKLMYNSRCQSSYFLDLIFSSVILMNLNLSEGAALIYWSNQFLFSLGWSCGPFFSVDFMQSLFLKGTWIQLL